MSAATNFYFFYQPKGGEDDWRLEQAEKRALVIAEKRPAFVTVLDLTAIPDDNDWSKTRYRGPLYFDFDADGDLERACDQFIVFLNKLDVELGFDITQARLYASGGKGFHIEIPQECFMAKVSPSGTPWLPYIYRAMAESVVVDTMDTLVYTGKRGRMWRTANVKRDNGNHKVPLEVGEALSMTPELYAELVKDQREEPVRTPPHFTPQFGMLFERSKEKVTTQMRGKKKRSEKAVALLDPWKKANKTPPTIDMIMNGENLAEGASFQKIAMQLAIYASSMGMKEHEFLDRCKGLCENHVSDGTRYNTVAKRRTELARMLRYFEDDSLYDFDPGPIVRLVKKGVSVTDLGVMDTEDHEDQPAQDNTPASTEEGEETATPSTSTTVDADLHRGVRKGFFMNSDGMWKRVGENTESICRATLRKVESFFSVETGEFRGFAFDLAVKGSKTKRTMLAADAFTAAGPLKKFFAAHQISFQGGDPDAMSLLDVMAEKARKGGRVYTYPREGFFVIDNPELDTPTPVKVYLTKDSFLSSVPSDDETFFRLAYKPEQAISSYNIDIHRAPELDASMRGSLHDLFSFTREDVAADLIGWFVAAHYRSMYLKLFRQFPMLQVYGEAGSGKTQTVWMLAHMHWYMNDITVLSAMSSTNFALDSSASTSTSAPCIIDEYKPRELRTVKGRLEKLKDVFKAAYTGGDIGNRGTINKGAENNLSTIKSKATAPIVFMGEAIEMETAIIERSVTVGLTQSLQTRARQAAFNRLHSDGTALSALGREIVEMGFNINLDAMRKEVRDIQQSIEARMPDFDDDTRKRAAPRMIFNRAVIVHGLTSLKRILARRYGTEFDASIDALLASKSSEQAQEQARVVASFGMSEISKVLSRIALLSREREVPWAMVPDKDYVVGDGWIEICVERAYDRYRRYCASIHETALFDTLEAFMHALKNYNAVVDHLCIDSELREEGMDERIFRLSMRTLRREGVNTFRTA